MLICILQQVDFKKKSHLLYRQGMNRQMGGILVCDNLEVQQFPHRYPWWYKPSHINAEGSQWELNTRKRQKVVRNAQQANNGK